MEQTLSKVKNLEKYIQKHGDDPFITQTISKMLTYKIQKYGREIKRLGKELKKFERSYKKESSTFFKEFKTGKLGDDMNFVEWSSLYQMHNRLLKQKSELEGMKQMIQEHLEGIIQELSTNPVVFSFKVIKQEVGEDEGSIIRKEVRSVGGLRVRFFMDDFYE